jgi:CubicO group peptidase (beta-lactamase class C family)
MKNIILIVILIFSFQNNLFASEASNQNQFNQWLLKNGHSQYLKDGGAKVDLCATFKKNSDAWLHEECGNYPKGKMVTMNNLNIKIANKALSGTNITYHANPNRDTLIYYLWKYSYRDRSSHLKEFKPTNSSYDFKFNLIEDEFLKKQMKTKGILSYLYYQDGEVLIDELSPKERLGDFLNNETKFYSMSMGKSVTSYILGHAICEGYIDGVDARVNDWPVIKDSIYYDQKLINFLNMNTGDQKYIDEFEDGISKLGAYEDRDIETTMRLFFRNKNIKKSKERYNYNGFVTQLILNYIKFKTGEDYKKLYSKVFNDKIKIKNSIRYGYTSFKEHFGNGHPNIMATRFDYLRIAKAIMDDYQNDTCVGKYLKEIYERRIPKKLTEERNEPAFNRTKSYGGQFHMDFPGLKDKIIFGMGGYGGNMILIDVENSRILVVNSLHYNNKKYKYNHKKLLHDPFKKGK